MVITTEPGTRARKTEESKLVRCPICGEWMDKSNWGSVLTHEHRGMTHHMWKKIKLCKKVEQK
jgi:hypothetical protein